MKNVFRSRNIFRAFTRRSWIWTKTSWKVKNEIDEDEDDGCDDVCDVVWWCDVVLWCCIAMLCCVVLWCYVVMLCCDVVLWCCVVMLCCDVMLFCDVVCDGVWDVVCDGVSCVEGSAKVKWMILSCKGVLLTDGQTNERTNGHWWL